MSEKQLIPTEDYINAKNISLYVNSELSGESNILRPDKADNVFDFSLKFEQERNASSKFCLYGLIESKWADCNNVRIEFRIGDSSTNTGNKISNFPFWIYDKSSNVSGLTWTTVSRPLDARNGDLSKNLYGKKKGNYFFPFEIDLNLLTKTNKSIYASVLEVEYNISTIEEFPFLFFDEDSNVLEYGSETAEILDDGNIIEINNNYPFFYDRHWIRREVEPTGPAFVFFNENQVTINEGGPFERTIENKTINLELSLSKPPKGYEQVKLQIVYGLDENDNEYTTVNLPQDVLLNLNTIEWNGPNASITQTVTVQIPDDFYVEPVERLTLKIVPILGVMADPEKPQLISLYIIDNDVPSKIAFSSNSFEFTEPRQDIAPYEIPLKLSLDKKLLVPDQSVEIYVDENETDCKSIFGFMNFSGSGFSNTTTLILNTTDLEYSTTLYFLSSREDDLQRKIVLKLRNFTSNVIPGSFNQGQEVNYTIYVNKNLDKNFVEIIIPYDTTNGIAVMRSAFNKPESSTSYSTEGLQDYPTSLMTYYNSNEGNVAPFTILTGNTNRALYRSLVFETNFKINIRNSGSQFIFDNKLYKNNETLSVTVTSGFTTGVSTDQFIFDGKKFILRLPANDRFKSSPLGGGFSLFLPNSFINQFSGQTWGFSLGYYEIEIQNLTYNIALNSGFFALGLLNQNQVRATNLLTRQLTYAVPTGTTSGLQTYSFYNYINADAGNSTNKKTYYLYTQVKNVFSQIDFGEQIVNSYSSTTVQYTENNLFYPGILILPINYRLQNGAALGGTSNNVGSYPSWLTPPANSPYKTTISRIFLTNDQLLLDNSFISGTTSSSPGSFNLPISNIILKKPYDQYQKKVRLIFGQLFVQAGYLNAQVGTSSSAGWPPFTNSNQNSTVNDSFVLATVDYTSAISLGNKKRFLYRWAQANVNTKNQAVIEIYNDGLVSCEIFGKVLNPDEKIWISENPLTINNPGTYNVVRPLNNLVVEVPTNDGYLQTIQVPNIGGQGTRTRNYNAFSRARYRISFLNFNIYNFDGTFTNKVVNKSFSANLPIDVQYVGQNPVFPIKNYFLKTKFTPNIWAPANLSGILVCNGNQVTNLKLVSSSSSNNRSVFVNGFIATASSNAAIKSIYFDDTPANFGNNCGSNGIAWTKSNIT